MLFWKYLTTVCLLCIKLVSSQGVACYKCMTIDPNNDACQDPFSSLLNQIQYDCQVEENIRILFDNVIEDLFRRHLKEKMEHFQLDFV